VSRRGSENRPARMVKTEQEMKAIEDDSAARDSFERLEEADEMPFGKWKGRPLRKVRALYFRWLWIEAGFYNFGVRRDVAGAVADYIDRHLEEFRKRTPKHSWPDATRQCSRGALPPVR